MSRLGLVLFAIFLIASGSAHAADRGLGGVVSAGDDFKLALVIGNSDYASLPSLRNPKADAELMARVLERAGFRVTRLVDATERDMKRAFVEFGRELRERGNGGTGLFYYAGHGVQAFDKNFLLPVDGQFSDIADLEIGAIEASWILAQMESAGTGVNIIILDACRDAPFKSASRSVSRGLARMDAPQGSFIAYSTSPGNVALDGTGVNSPYTTALAEELLRRGDRPIEAVFKSVRLSVIERTGRKQVPWESSSLLRDFRFFPVPQDAAPTGDAAPASPLASLAPAAPVPPGVAAEEALGLTPADIGVMLRDLRMLGFDLDPAAGRLGYRERAALMEFQRASGLDATGYLDMTTVFRLRSAADAARGARATAPVPDAAEPPVSAIPAPPPVAAPVDRASPPPLGFDMDMGTVLLSPSAIEDALKLTTSRRREIQRRLTLLGHDTNGVDGVFGAGTRRAISRFQGSLQRPQTGYLTAVDVGALESRSEAKYQAWKTQAARTPTPQRKPSPAARPSGQTGRYVDSRGCLREASGRYVPGFRSDCR